MWRQLLSKLRSVIFYHFDFFAIACQLLHHFNVRFAITFLVAPTWGPLGRDVDTITSALCILLDGPSMNALDQTISPVQLNEKVIVYVCSHGAMVYIGLYA